ncbi:ATP-binding protein [Pseudorhodoplanes sp.]|uniref:ATP-binding protein n=1 Tax=Pseudorhodoplanes sp. TaxID=1934341 RepID=UPI003D10695F
MLFFGRIMGRGTPKHKATTQARKAARKRKPASPSHRRAVETALASLAHDIRTPLTGILALSELLATSDLSERERGWAQAIHDAADHLAQQTSIVLDAVKAGRAGLIVRKDVFAPRKLAEAIAASLSARAGTNGLAAEVAIAADFPAQAVGDPVRLRAALENLIDNAVKFTARGRVGFTVGAETRARGRTMLRFSVSDSGIGLTKAEIARLFRPFAQASRDVSLHFGGTGLGLVLVKRLAQAMGGDLTVASRKGEGSTFTLTVMVHAAPGPRSPTSADEAAAAHPARSLRILCAEDNPYGRAVLNAILTRLGHSVDYAGTGEAAVSAIARGGYDLVLMDVTLPGVDGLEATRRIRALPGRAAQVPIIGLSGRTSDDDASNARVAGMTDYLPKPVSPAALVEALGRVATQQQETAA